MAQLLNKIKNVDIDVGKFKYILINVHHYNKEADEQASKKIVRGYSAAPYHADIYDMVTPEVEQLGLDCECLGGGRIIHDPDKKEIEVYGYSQGYGRADHSVTCEILKVEFNNYNVKWTNDGY